MTVEEHRNLTLVQAVLLRPRIFTVNGTLVELLSFFRGCMHHPHGEAAQDDGSLRMLFDWLSQECDIDSRSLFPTRIYDALIARFGDDQAALDFIRAESLAPEDHVILL